KQMVYVKQEILGSMRFWLSLIGGNLRSSILDLKSPLLSHRQSLPDRRVIIEQPDDQRMRVGIGLVDVGELDESGAESIRATGAFQGIAVALALEKSAQGVECRSQGQAEDHQHQHQKR